MQADEDLANGARQPIIQREALALPVSRDAQPPMLILDIALVLAHPLPDALDERLAAHLVTVRTFFGDGLLYDGLGRDAGVVFAGNPQRLIAEHAVVANHDVFERRRDGMPQVQRARHVGWRHADDEGAPIRVRAGARAEVAVALPPLIEALLDRLRLIGFRNLVESARSLLLLDLQRLTGHGYAALSSKQKRLPLSRTREGARGSTLVRGARRGEIRRSGQSQTRRRLRTRVNGRTRARLTAAPPHPLPGSRCASAHLAGDPVTSAVGPSEACT